MTTYQSDTESGILGLAREAVEEIVAIRRDIHAHPELGFEEHRTSGLIAEKLSEWGLTEIAQVGGTGIVATIRGKRPSNRVIGFRADMDALAMGETNRFPHASVYAGRMHACGHDGHTAMLLGAARKLAADPDFAGTIQLIFQPAEEGGRGAPAMLKDGLFSRFPCDRIFGLHSWPNWPVGTFGTRSGPLMAASGRWVVTLAGPGGHGGAAPHRSADLTVIAAGLIQGLQTIISRNVAATDQAIISVGHISAGDAKALNVMPSELVIGGTLRAFDAEIQDLLERRIREMAELHAKTHGATAHVEAWWNAIPTITDAEATESAVAAAAMVNGDGCIDDRIPLTTGGEDFSYMLSERPGSFVFLGNGVRQGDGGGALHTPTYDFNDDSLAYGVAYWLALANIELDGQFGAK